MKKVSKSVSRVLSFKAVIFLDVQLPARSSHLLNIRPADAQKKHSVGVASDRVYMAVQSPARR